MSGSILAPGFRESSSLVRPNRPDEPSMTVLQHIGQVVTTHGLGQQKSLHLIAPQFREQPELFLRLNTLRDHGQLERPGQSQDRPYDRPTGAVARQAPLPWELAAMASRRSGAAGH